MTEDNRTDDGQPMTTGGHLQPVQGGESARVLIPKHREDLEASGLNEETINACGFYSETTSAPIADCLGYAWRGGGGMVLPFVDYDSRAVVLRRVKPNKPRVRVRNGKRKPIKYEHPPGQPSFPFFGPRTVALQRLNEPGPVVWTEGEKKTLALDQLGFAAIGLTGVHNFNDPDAYRNGDGLTWAKPLVKYAARFIAGRPHLIAYDSDSMTNDQVMLATRRLAGLLLDCGATSVGFVEVPGGDAKIGVDDFLAEHGEEKTRALFSGARPIAVGEEISPIAPRDPLVKLDSLAWIKPARVDKDLRLPPRFDIRRDRSLWLEPAADNAAADWREVTRSVVLPVRLMREHGGESERVELAWNARNEWRRVVMDRQSLRDARRVLSDSPPSMAITSNNAAAMVGWFEEYMRHNEDRLRCAHFVTRGGWQEDTGGVCFMLNEPIVRGADVELVGDETGDRAEILGALKPRGNYEDHIEAIKEAFEADAQAAVVILACLAAPLLKVFGAPNFTLNLYGDSSTGKTSMMKVAASIFYDPNNPQGIASWNATGTAMEVRAETLCDLPLPFDEAGAGESTGIDRVVYMLNNGTGKARSNQRLGVRETPRWRTITLSTGERELVDRHAATGAQIRVLQFRVSSFGGERGAAWVDALRERCEAHHGNVGRRWIEALVGIEDWRELREEYAAARAWFREQSSGQLMQRQAVYFALLWVAEVLAYRVLGLGDERGATVQRFFLEDEERDEIESAADRALESVSQWLVSNPESFPELEPNSSGKLQTSASRRLGRPIFGVRHGDRVYVLTSALRERFAGENLSYTEAVKSWAAAGLTICDAKRADTRLTFNGERPRVVGLSCEALGVDPMGSNDEFND